MKKFKVAALLMCFVAFSFAMTSCQKAEDLIVGKWKCVKVTEGDQAYTDEQNVGFIYEFNADNTCNVEGMDGTYAINDDVLTLTFSVMGVSTSMNLNIDKINKRTMILSGEVRGKTSTAEFERQ